MQINSKTIGATEGSIKIYLDGKEEYGIITLDTKNKYVEKYSRDDKGQVVINNGEPQLECVPFEMATVRFDNVIIEVN